MRPSSLYIILLMLLSLHGCATVSNTVDYAKKKVLVNDTDGKPIESAEVLYARGIDLMAKTQYSEAIVVMDEVGELYPFSKLAQRAMIMSGYLNYKSKHYGAAEATMEHFIDSYGNHKDIAYAYYMRAMSQYRQIRSISHDREIAAKAYVSMAALVSRFPSSSYAHDVMDRMLLVEYYMAANDVEVGRFYMKSRQFIAAMGRFNKYLGEYPGTYYTPEVLYRLVVCSELLGLRAEAVKYHLLLTYNAPYSVWREEVDKFVKSHVKHKTSYDSIAQKAGPGMG